MKRYKHDLNWPQRNDNEVISSIIYCEDGEWVKWKDVKILVGKLRGLETKIARIEDGCNCEEIVVQFFHEKKYIHDSNHWWICPAHGYKKL